MDTGNASVHQTTAMRVNYTLPMSELTNRCRGAEEMTARGADRTRRSLQATIGGSGVGVAGGEMGVGWVARSVVESAVAVLRGRHCRGEDLCIRRQYGEAHGDDFSGSIDLLYL